MPSTTTNSIRQHHSVLSRVRGWRPLAKAGAAVGAAAAVTAGVTLSMLRPFRPGLGGGADLLAARQRGGPLVVRGGRRSAARSCA
jgi:gamma-glutamyltranspeptidase